MHVEPNSGGTDGWTHPDDLHEFIASHEENDFGSSAFPRQDAQPPALRIAPEADISRYGRPAPLRLRTIARKQQFQVYGFGKTVWELYVGGKPVNENDLIHTPPWVQDLVRRCCKEITFASMDEVLFYIESHSE